MYTCTHITTCTLTPVFFSSYLLDNITEFFVLFFNVLNIKYLHMLSVLNLESLIYKLCYVVNCNVFIRTRDYNCRVLNLDYSTKFQLTLIIPQYCIL